MKLLIAGRNIFSEEKMKKLNSLFDKVYFVQDESKPLNENCFDADIVICNNLFSFIDYTKFSNLKYVQFLCSGMDRVPNTLLCDSNIITANVAGSYVIPMTEFVLSTILYRYKNLSFFVENKKRNVWEKERHIFELYNKKVVLFGCGNVGMRLASLFKSFGCRVTGVDERFVCDGDIDEFVPSDSFLSAVDGCDVLVLSASLNDQTYHIVDKSIFDRLKKSCIVINCSRGALIDSKCLVEWLQKNDESYAILDVFEEEPLPANSVLWELKNVFISPHNSYISENNNERLSNLAMQNICLWTKK